MVIITSPICGACRASIPAFQNLYFESKDSPTQFVVAVPGLEQSQSYLRESGLGGAVAVDWRDLSLSPLGTPMVAVVDPQGLVRRTWLGPVNTVEQEIELLSALKEPAAVAPPRRRLDSGEKLLTLQEANAIASEKGGEVRIINVTKRDQFAVEHLPGSINIPWSELGARALFELDPLDFNVVDCSLLTDQRCSNAIRELRFLKLEISPLHALGDYPTPWRTSALNRPGSEDRSR